MKRFRIRDFWARKAVKDDICHTCVRNDIVRAQAIGQAQRSSSFSSSITSEKSKIRSLYSYKGDEDDKSECKPGKNVCFQKTVYSDSIIVDAPPQKKQSENESARYYVNKKRNKVQENVKEEFKCQEQHLTRDQVIHMLKSRFKDDLENWQKRERRPTDVRSEPSRSPPLSPRKRYGVLIQTPEVYPTLPRKTEGKSGSIWLQCGDEIKQVELPREGVTLPQIRQLFQTNFQNELKKFAFGVNRSILLIKDPFSRAFKELDDARCVVPGSHLKLLGPKKKPCRDREHHHVNKSVSFDERRRSRSFTSETSVMHDSTISAPAGFSRARVGSYSFHGHPRSGSSGTLKRDVVTSTPKPNHSNVRPSDMFSQDLPKARHNETPSFSGKHDKVQHSVPAPLNHKNVPQSQLNEPMSPSRKVRLPGLGVGFQKTKRAPRSPVEEQLASLTSLLQEALRTDSVDDFNRNGCESSSDSLNVPARPDHLPLKEDKRRSPSDSGTESLLSENHGTSPDVQKCKPPPPSRSSSKEAMKSHAPKRQCETKENSPESPKRSVARPRVWVDTTCRARANQIKVTSAYLKKDVKQMKIQLAELRNQHEYNAHVFNTLLAKTGQQIMAAIEGAMSDHADSHVSLQRKRLLAEEVAYQRRSDNAEKAIGRLESDIEMLRNGAVNFKESLNSNELKELHASIENFSRSIASLKSDFGALNNDARGIMAEELHSLIEEERFFKEEPARLERLVDRCRHAAGTLFTLQKLASAQQEMMNSDEKKTYSSTSKVEYNGRLVTVDYNQNIISPGNGIKTKVRFNDSADHITYHQ